MKNLSNLAVESDECRALLQDSMIGPFLDKIERRAMGIVFETAPWKDQSIFFWKFVLREALHSASFGMFSDKSVLSFLERVQASKLRSGWLQCRRDYAVYLQDDGRVYVLYPSSFPFAQKDMYDVVGQGEEIVSSIVRLLRKCHPHSIWHICWHSLFHLSGSVRASKTGRTMGGKGGDRQRRSRLPRNISSSAESFAIYGPLDGW